MSAIFTPDLIMSVFAIEPNNPPTLYPLKVVFKTKLFTVISSTTKLLERLASPILPENPPKL